MNEINQAFQVNLISQSETINQITLQNQRDNIQLITDIVTMVPGGSHGVAESQIFVLTEQDISRKYVTIDQEIFDNQSVLVFIEGSGILAEVGIDYSLSGQEVFWSSFAFENVLVEGDKLRVIFN